MYPKKLNFLFKIPLLLFLLSSLIIGCSKEKKAIKITQEAIHSNPEMTFNILGIAMKEVFSGEADDFEWKAKKTKEKDVYLVSLINKNIGRGYYWETNVKTRKVVYVNNNRYLCHKYGLTSKDFSGKFTLAKLEMNTLKFVTDKNGRKKLIYKLEGYIKNNTKFMITNGGVKCILNIVFKEKTIKKSSFGFDLFAFKDIISRENPWKPGESKKFECTIDVDPIYIMNYKPEFLVTDVILKASDPINFKYKGVIEELEVKLPTNKVRL